MQLKELEIKSKFRGLQPGFTISFSRPQQKANYVEPICLVGLNGSGKSNLMQALAEIFFYLENYVLQDSQAYTVKDSPFDFRIAYSMPLNPANFIDGIDKSEWLRRTGIARDVEIVKETEQAPVFKLAYQHPDIAMPLTQVTDKKQQPRLLPWSVIGYSSGMNELLSNSFIKMDFFYLETFKEKMRRAEKGETPFLTVNRLFYLDYNSNALAIIANFMMKENFSGDRMAEAGKYELDIINNIVGIDDLVSFRVRIRYPYINITIEKKEETAGDDEGEEEITRQNKRGFPSELNRVIENLSQCCSTIEKAFDDGDNENPVSIEMNFVVDAEMKRAFREKFRGGAMGLFEKLYLMNLMNMESFSDDLKHEIRNADIDTNIGELLPKVAAEEKIFHIDNVRLKKRNGQKLYYRQLSDGEHQYLQVAGSLMLLDDPGILFLLDEPETHFNPEWRSRLISTLNEIVDRKMNNDIDYVLALKNFQEKIITEEEFGGRKEKYMPQQEIILTTHSPFIVSDCQRDNVYIFSRGTEGVQYRKPGINTYGTSVDLIMEEVFSKTETIAEMSFNDLQKLKENLTSLDAIKNAKEESKKMGESVEKVFLFNYLIEKEKELKANAGKL